MPEFSLRLELMFALVAFICFGLTDFFRKKGAAAGANPVGYLLVETIVVLSAVPLVGLLLYGKIPDLSHGTVPYALLSGVTIMVALVALMSGLGVGEGSVVIPVSRLGLALATLLSLVFLSESVTWSKLAGLGLAVAAVYLLSR
ncbi:MAG: EamA family transporter [Candidatus Caldarchaeum sp.]|nr:EamA family transporter [Candidatus Caldarchaeum sp.]MCX8201235.1 EamA family transporter [Candidatus Caldarchaeum sp.]MDW8063034.1 EamA family transporter [Candidatus Caldarchaeum sp.]MDW8434925.1 EamA family transporter [Candidatus Caldarchaeum sp.]